MDEAAAAAAAAGVEVMKRSGEPKGLSQDLFILPFLSFGRP